MDGVPSSTAAVACGAPELGVVVVPGLTPGIASTWHAWMDVVGIVLPPFGVSKDPFCRVIRVPGTVFFLFPRRLAVASAFGPGCFAVSLRSKSACAAGITGAALCMKLELLFPFLSVVFGISDAASFERKAARSAL